MELNTNTSPTQTNLNPDYFFMAARPQVDNALLSIKERFLSRDFAGMADDILRLKQLADVCESYREQAEKLNRGGNLFPRPEQSEES